MEWRFDWVTTWEEANEPGFTDWWRRLYESDPNATIFGNPALAWAWVEAREAQADSQPRFLIGRADGVEACLPLLLRRGRLNDACPRILQPVGYNDFDYHDPVFSAPMCSGPELSSFWHSVIAEVDEEYGGVADVLEIPRLHGNCCPGAVFSEPAPFINVGGLGDGASFQACLSKSMRADLRRQLRRLGDKGAVELRTATDIDAASVWLRGFLEAHSSRWGSDGKPRVFYETLFRRCLPLQLIQLVSLDIGNKPVAWALGFVDSRRYYYYKTAFAAEWENYSPGKVLLLRLLETAIARGMQKFDLLRGDEGYKRQWTESSDSLYRVWHQLPGIRARSVGMVRELLHGVGKPIKSAGEGMLRKCLGRRH